MEDHVIWVCPNCLTTTTVENGYCIDIVELLPDQKLRCAGIPLPYIPHSQYLALKSDLAKAVGSILITAKEALGKIKEKHE